MEVETAAFANYMCLVWESSHYDTYTFIYGSSSKIDDFPVLATCRSGTSAMLSSKVNGPAAHGSTW